MTVSTATMGRSVMVVACLMAVSAMRRGSPDKINGTILDPSVEAASILSVKPGVLQPALRNPNPGSDVAYKAHPDPVDETQVSRMYPKSAPSSLANSTEPEEEKNVKEDKHHAEMPMDSEHKNDLQAKDAENKASSSSMEDNVDTFKENSELVAMAKQAAQAEQQLAEAVATTFDSLATGAFKGGDTSKSLNGEESKESNDKGPTNEAEGRTDTKTNSAAPDMRAPIQMATSVIAFDTIPSFGEGLSAYLKPFPPLPMGAVLDITRPYSLIEQSQNNNMTYKAEIHYIDSRTDPMPAPKPCFDKEKCDRPQADPLNPKDWKTPEVVGVPSSEQKTSIPPFKNDISCCGYDEDHPDAYISDANNRTDSLTIDPTDEQTGYSKGSVHFHGGEGKQDRPCRPCSASQSAGYMIPEPAPSKYENPELEPYPNDNFTKVILTKNPDALKGSEALSQAFIESEGKTDPVSKGQNEGNGPAELLYGDENNKMTFTDAEVNADGSQKLHNPAYTQINSYDSKIKRTMENHAEFVEKLPGNDPEKPCINCKPKKIDPEIPKCVNCRHTEQGFLVPQYKPEPAKEESIKVVNLEINSKAESQEMCKCLCVTREQAATASKQIAGICPRCPPCEGKSSVKFKVDCEAQKKQRKRPDCAPVPGESIPLHKYRTLQKELRVIPEVTDSELNPEVPLPTAS